MLTLTESAISALKPVCIENNLGLRITVAKGSGCSGPEYRMGLESAPSSQDEVVDVDGIRVFVDLASSMWLAGLVVDYKVGTTGVSGFVFEHPNAKSSCGCSSGGSSGEGEFGASGGSCSSKSAGGEFGGGEFGAAESCSSHS